MPDPSTSTTLALTSEEQALLTEPSRYREVYGAQGFLSLAERSVVGLTVVDLSWSSSWSGARIERTLFRGCRFANHELGRAQYSSVTFQSCTFDHCDLSHAIFEDCQFVDCEINQGSALSISFHACRMIDTRVHRVTFRACRFDGVVAHGGRIDAVRFAACMLHLLQLEGVEVRESRLTRCEAGRVVLSGCTTRRLEILGGSFGSFEIGGGTLSSSSFAQAEVATLSLSSVSRAVGFRINRSRISELSVTSCAMSDLYWCESEIGQLHISGGRYTGWLTRCRIGKDSTIDRAELDSFFWDQTRSEGLAFSDLSLRGFLCARDTRFENLRLSNVSYAPDFELFVDETQFVNSDVFAPITLKAEP